MAPFCVSDGSALKPCKRKRYYRIGVAVELVYLQHQPCSVEVNHLYCRNLAIGGGEGYDALALALRNGVGDCRYLAACLAIGDDQRGGAVVAKRVGVVDACNLGVNVHRHSVGRDVHGRKFPGAHEHIYGLGLARTEGKQRYKGGQYQTENTLFHNFEGCFVVVSGVGCASAEIKEFKEIREFKEAESLVSPLPKLPKFLLCRLSVDGRQLTLFYSSASSAMVV